MSSFSIIDNNNLRYKLAFIPIFELSETIWNNLLKTQAFNIVYPNQTVLFTGSLSGLSNMYQQVEIKIKFNLYGKTDYIEEIISFPLDFGMTGGLFSTINHRYFLPINFVKTFTQPGLYDVSIETSNNFSSGISSIDYVSAFTTRQTDFFNLNANLYELISEEDNFEL